MKVKTDIENYSPVTLSITLENFEEFRAIKNFLSFNTTIPRAFSEVCVVPGQVEIVKRLMIECHGRLVDK